MLVLFTDFGADDIYVAQLKAALLQRVPPGTMILDLLHSAPSFRPRAGAHLLAALQAHFAEGTVFLAVIDPGVGGDRGGAVLNADRRWFVGPDNGLLSVVAARAKSCRTWRITWRPETLSSSFHARDLFAPVAADIEAGSLPVARVEESPGLEVNLGSQDLAEVIHIDHYGNVLTGLRAAGTPPTALVEAGSHHIRHAGVFGEALHGEPIWFANSIGLVEIAENCGGAATQLGLKVGDPVTLRATQHR